MVGILVAEHCRYFRIGASQIQDDEVVINTHRSSSSEMRDVHTLNQIDNQQDRSEGGVVCVFGRDRPTG
jgi:hypothetical protein